MCQTASEFLAEGRGASPKDIIQYTDDSTIAATAMIGKSSTPYRATELRQCALLMQLALPVPGSCPAAYTLEQQVLRHLVSHRVEHAIEFLADRWPLLLSIAILAPISDLAEPERCRSHGDLGTILEILG